MAGSPRKRSKRNWGGRGKVCWNAGWLGLCVLLAACQPGPAPNTVPGAAVTPPSPGPPGRPLPQPSARGRRALHRAGGHRRRLGAKKVLDVVAGLKPHLNLTLGDFAYKAGLEQQFCDMVTGRLGEDFPYQLVTGNHESDGHDGDIEKYVQCLPNKLPGLQGEYGTSGGSMSPSRILLSGSFWFPPASTSGAGSRWTTRRAASAGAGPPTPSTRPNRRRSLDRGGHAHPLPQRRQLRLPGGQEFTNMLIEKEVGPGPVRPRPRLPADASAGHGRQLRGTRSRQLHLRLPGRYRRRHGAGLGDRVRHRRRWRRRALQREPARTRKCAISPALRKEPEPGLWDPGRHGHGG